MNSQQPEHHADPNLRPVFALRGGAVSIQHSASQLKVNCANPEELAAIIAQLQELNDRLAKLAQASSDRYDLATDRIERSTCVGSRSNSYSIYRSLLW